jgi:arsenite-transporting ATPase
LLLVAGKGGVGKTTVACATALHLADARQGRRVLLFSSDPAHSLSGCLDMAVGPQEVRIGPGLTAVEVDPAAELARLKKAYAEDVATLFARLGGEGAGVEFDGPVVEQLLNLSPPGLDELMALCRLVELINANRYDVFVVDTAPSGHFIRLLEMPAMVQDWLKVMFTLLLKYRNVFRLPQVSEQLVELSRAIKMVQGLLQNPTQGKMLLVSILTPLAFEKTTELLQASDHAGLTPAGLILNLATPLGPCPLCRGLLAQEAQVAARFRSAFTAIPQAVVYRTTELRGLARLEELGRGLYPD